MNSLENSKLATCPVCPHFCSLKEGELGFCRARRARNGVVVDENYGRITSIALDPIEKKPFARFYPGSKVLSVGSYGCNLRCPFCQNASIACADESTTSWKEVFPSQLVGLALEAQADGNIGIAYTYNEPLVGYEFIRDTGKMAHEVGLKNVLVSNGMINPGPFSELINLIDAANIDLKGFSQKFYDIVDGDFECVKRTITTLATESLCHLEVTTLIIPGLNDSEEEIDAAAKWLASLGGDITYHITRFFPCHKMTDKSPTPVKDIYNLAEIARKYLRHVYVGNC